MNLNLYRKTINILIIFFTLLWSSSAFSWGSNGHRIIGDIANRHINSNANQKITDILGHSNLAKISTIPDDNRVSTASFKWMIYNKNEYKDTSIPWNLSASWHFINSNDNFVINYKGDNLYTQFEVAVKIIRNNKSSKEEKKNAIIWITHLVGDVHQPLHVGRLSDKGGNTIKVKLFGRMTNLHEVWDSGLINIKKLSYTEYSNFLVISDFVNQKDFIAKTKINEIKQWIKESNLLAKLIYSNVNQNDNLGFTYLLKNHLIVEKQLTLGGMRLAKLFNELFN